MCAIGPPNEVQPRRRKIQKIADGEVDIIGFR
jgi:hypothetical protein